MPDAVTGAYSFTGRALAHRLLGEGRELVALVRRPAPPDLRDPRIRDAPLRFDDPEGLVAALRGVDTLYNTFWIRFPRAELTYEVAIEHTRQLLAAAARAGVRRLVHVSVVNASPSAPTPYFTAKARLEADVQGSGLSVAIVRPTLTFGPGDILVNNLCWVLRRFPAFAIPGDGRYRLQPVHVDDVAEICVRSGLADIDGVIVDAAGPEILTFNEFVTLLARAVRRRPWLFHVAPTLSLAASRVLGLLVNDVLLTADEVTELTASLLVSDRPPTGTIRLSEWAMASADGLGLAYHSELDRHFRTPANEGAA